MTPVKYIFLFNVVAVVACLLITKYADESSGENSMSAELPVIFILGVTIVLDVAFIVVKTAKWLFT
jgi:hypothetical protein